MKSTLTTDFTGTYGYPAEEAQAVADYFCDDYASGLYTLDQMHQRIIREREHWIRAFGNDEQGKADMARFTEVFNAFCYQVFNFAM